MALNGEATQTDVWVESFFADVREFSRDYLKVRSGLPAFSSNGGGELAARGVVLHYTTDANAHSVAAWLCDARSEASAHFLIAEKQLIEEPAENFAAARAYALPASIIQLRPLTETAWHATWANSWSFAVEICNGGELRRDLQNQVHSYRGDRGWQPNASLPAQNPLRAGQRVFCGYSDAQLQSLNLLLFALCWRYGLTPASILGHDHVQGRRTPGSGAHDKRDLGPGFGLDSVRNRLLGTSAREFARSYRDDSSGLRGPPTYLKQKLFEQVGLSEVEDELLRARACSGQGEAAQEIFRQLGYSLAPEAGHLRIFQRMMGLEPDGVLGPQTCTAAAEHHRDRLSAPAPVQTGQTHGY